MPITLSEVREIIASSKMSYGREDTVRDMEDDFLPFGLKRVEYKKEEKDMDGNMKMVFEYSTPGAAVGEEHIVRLEADQDSREPIVIIQTTGNLTRSVKLSQKEAKMLWKAFRNLDSAYDFFDNF
jgi:hypothetical protein